MTATTESPPAEATDERLADLPLWRRLLTRPEAGSVIGAILVWLLFAWQADAFVTWRGTATYLDTSSFLGIMAVAVALLMIGGEFDLSAGVMIGFSGMITALLSVESGWNLWPSMAVSLACCLAVGAANGYMVVRTGLPSFIITLGTFFILRGFNLWLTQAVTDNTNVTGVDETGGYDAAEKLFSSTLFHIGQAGFGVNILWWVGATALATYVLLRTDVGNWIFGVGGNKEAARNIGVPATATKIGLFMTTAGAGWLVGTLVLIQTTRSNVIEGVGQEFEFIIAAVLGGCLLTGGYGSAIGAAFGALIFGMTRQGIVLAGWNNNLFFLFLGVILLVATVTNTWIRQKAQAASRRSKQ